MIQIILIILAIVIIMLLVFRRTREPIVGICSSALDQTVRKSANKEKIAALLRERGDLSNADIRGALKVSERSIVRYMNQLEREGMVEQVGTTGRSVIYRLKT